MKFFLPSLLAIALIAPLMAANESAQPASPRASYNFNPDWRLLVADPQGAEAPNFDDKAWKPVTLPHAWNEDSAFKVAIADMPTGIAWYRKTFQIPTDAAGRKVFIEFEGAHQAAEVWVNGQPVGLHENGITAFGFDITNLVKPAPQQNVIAVRTDNSYSYQEKATATNFQWNHKSFYVSYGGLTKNVRLHVTGKLYQTLPLFTNLGTTGTYVSAADFDIPGKAATVQVESEVRNETGSPQTFAMQVDLKDADGRLVKSFQGKSLTVASGATALASTAERVTSLNFWSWGYGYLYDVTTTLLVQGKPVDAVTTRTGFRKTHFAGGMLTLNDRAIYLKGYAQRTTNEWPALGSSVPPWLSDYSNRLMVESGANLVRWMHVTPWKQDVESCDRVGLIQAMPAGDAERDVSGRQWDQRVEVMRDATIYNRNNPSIIFYESGNKGISEKHMAEMKAVRDTYDPRGGRAAGCREMLESKIAEWGGEMLYVNKSVRIPFWQTEYSRDEGLRKYWDEFSPPYHQDGTGKGVAAAYNRNQDSHAIEDIVRWYDFWRERPGTGTRVNGGAVNIVFSDTNTHCRGQENYRRSGEVDAMRIPKDGYWAHQIMWNGWVDVEKPGIHILGHWNYAPGVKKDVQVVSSTDQVELFLNGKSLGKGTQSYRYLYTFQNIAWQPGELRAVGLDALGKEVCTTSHITSGDPVAVRLSAITRPTPLRADGSDGVLVEVEVVDAKGQRCPTALDPIEFSFDGPVEWRGGIAQAPDNGILAQTLPVECGVNRVFLRSTREPGKIILTAKSGSLKSSQIEFTSQPVVVTAGLNPQTLSDGLPAFLGRGPTPAGPSFQPTRLTVPIVRASAEDGGSPTKAFDDDETTDWIGKKPITFDFGHSVRLDGITAKFTGFRARSYPIRVSLDGKEIFRGATPRSLGYVTLPFKPVEGRMAKIELLGEADAQEAFAGIKELEDQKNATTGEEKVGKGELAIAEIEFHQEATASQPSISP